MAMKIPQEPLLTAVLKHWQESPKRTVIRDQREYTVEELLYDVSTAQKQIYDSLEESVKEQLRKFDTNVFFGVLAGPGYGFAMLVLAIYWIGGVVVPLC